MTNCFTNSTDAGQDDVRGSVYSTTFAGAIAIAMNDLRDGDFGRGLVVLGTALKAQSTRRPQTTPPLA